MRSAILRYIFILLSSYSWLVLADRNVTIDNLDPSVILFPFRAWAWSNEGHGTNRGAFSFSNSENATATITFSQNATAVFWQGFKRSGPALYSVCIDCTTPSQAQIVSGHDDSWQATDSVAILFSRTHLSNTRHNITITNLLDPRFGLPSQITLDAFILTVSDSSSSSSSSTSTADAVTQMPAEMSMPSGPSSTMVAYWSNPRPEVALSTGAIVGIAFAGAIGLFGLAGLGWWLLKWRKGSYGKVSHATFGGQHDEKRGLTRAESPMFRTLQLPPRDAEQASMFGSTLDSEGHTPYKASPYPLTHRDSPRAPSIRSALSSLLSHTPSHRSTSSRSEWGTIHVALSNPFTSPHDAETESEWDFDTPLPSSTLGSTFTTTPEDLDIERTPTLGRGWRRVEDVHDGYNRPPRDLDPSVIQTHRPGKSAWEQRTPLPLI